MPILFFGYVQKKMNELNKVNDISKINENSVSLFRAKFEIRFTPPILAGNSRMMKSLFHSITENAIHSIFPPCHHPARLNQRNPEPSSRKDYCKPIALYADHC
jgi:hypothetical protein